MARIGFVGAGNHEVQNGSELAYLMLFGNRSFDTMKDNQAAYDFFKRCMEVHGWWLTTREILAERKRSAQENLSCKNPGLAARNPDICPPLATTQPTDQKVTTPAQPATVTASTPAATLHETSISWTKVETRKLLAQLYLIKGPIVSNPPQTFRGSFTPDGKAEVTLAGNRTLSGTFESFPVSESIRARFKPVLVNPDGLKISRGTDLKGFAVLSDGTGTELECVYSLNNATGRGEGTCADNQRNTYRIVFD
jgi:hypothetical protein